MAGTRLPFIGRNTPALVGIGGGAFGFGVGGRTSLEKSGTLAEGREQIVWLRDLDLLRHR